MSVPAKVSPAPVGSITVSVGKAGSAINLSSVIQDTPCSPFFTTTYLGPRPAEGPRCSHWVAFPREELGFAIVHHHTRDAAEQLRHLGPARGNPVVDGIGEDDRACIELVEHAVLEMRRHVREEGVRCVAKFRGDDGVHAVEDVEIDGDVFASMHARVIASVPELRANVRERLDAAKIDAAAGEYVAGVGGEVVAHRADQARPRRDAAATAAKTPEPPRTRSTVPVGVSMVS